MQKMIIVRLLVQIFHFLGLCKSTFFVKKEKKELDSFVSSAKIQILLSNLLQINRTLKVLNIESNFVTGEGIVSILRALENNNCLEELRFDNQRQQFGNKVSAFIIVPTENF